MDHSQLRRFFGIRKYLGGEQNSPVVEQLTKGSLAAGRQVRVGNIFEQCSCEVHEPNYVVDMLLGDD
eukprot:1296283-Pyramimonas_sp.AAC.1